MNVDLRLSELLLVVRAIDSQLGVAEGFVNVSAMVRCGCALVNVRPKVRAEDAHALRRNHSFLLKCGDEADERLKQNCLLVAAKLGNLLLHDVQPFSDSARRAFAFGCQRHKHGALVLLAARADDKLFALQRRYRVAHCRGRELEPRCNLAHRPLRGAVVRKRDQKLNLNGTESRTLTLVPDQRLEQLSDALEPDGNLAVEVVLICWVKGRGQHNAPGLLASCKIQKSCIKKKLCRSGCHPDLRATYC